MWILHIYMDYRVYIGIRDDGKEHRNCYFGV